MYVSYLYSNRPVACQPFLYNSFFLQTASYSDQKKNNQKITNQNAFIRKSINLYILETNSNYIFHLSASHKTDQATASILFSDFNMEKRAWNEVEKELDFFRSFQLFPPEFFPTPRGYFPFRKCHNQICVQDA